MFNLLPFALLLEVFAYVGASPVDAAFEAAHPMITQRAELFIREAPASLVGYYYTTDGDGNTVITSSEKPGSAATFRDNTLVDWCSDDSSYMSNVCPTAYWTSCDGSTLKSEGGSTSCTSRCDYDIIYTAGTSDSNYLQWYHCMDRSFLYFYREQPTGTLIEDMTTTESSSTETFSSESSSESSSDPSSTETTTNTASPASSVTSVASQTSDPTGSSTPIAEPAKEKEASKAWIAGVVIGIVGLLAVAGMGFYLWRQRQQKHAYGPAPQGPTQAQAQPGYSTQQSAYYPPPQQTYGNGPSPYLQPVSPNMSAYDAQVAKPQEDTMYGGYAPQQYGSPPPGVGTVQMPQASPQVQPHMTANMHEMPELAPSSGR